jgi:PAS domain S-box-containing protein
MHRLFAEQLRCATDAFGQVDLAKLAELVSAAYEASDRERQRTIEVSAQSPDEVEQDLLRTQDFLDTIVENIPIAVFAKCAKDSRYILLNRAGEDYYGLPREQMLGKTPEEIFPADVARIVSEQDRKVVASGMPMFLEEHLIEIGVKGHDRVINSRKMLITDGAGDPQYLVGMIEDVTERVNTQERISHLAHHDALTDLPNRSAFNATLG